MSKRRLVISAVLAGSTQSEAARTYGVTQGWVSRLMARYAEEGEAAFQGRSRRPATVPRATPPATVELALRLREQLGGRGLDAGADTIRWHLAQHHGITISRTTVHRILTRAGAVTPEPKKRPKSSYVRFAAEQPNETWQSDFTHYRLTRQDGTPGQDVEIITWLDDHSRYALHVTSHARITGQIVLATFRQACDQHGHPASTLTDNGMVYSTRFAGGRGGRTALEHELRALDIVQKNSSPHHRTTCGKVERFQQTMKNWLRAQPVQPRTLDDLDALLADFTDQYNHHRPHRALDRRTPAAAYAARPKATPTGDRTGDTHDRVRTDKIYTNGTVTLRYQGVLHKIGVGREHAGTHVLLLVQDNHVTIVNKTTGQVLRELLIDPTRTYHGTGRPTGPPKRKGRTHTT